MLFPEKGIRISNRRHVLLVRKSRRKWKVLDLRACFLAAYSSSEVNLRMSAQKNRSSTCSAVRFPFLSLSLGLVSSLLSHLSHPKGLAGWNKGVYGVAICKRHANHAVSGTMLFPRVLFFSFVGVKLTAWEGKIQVKSLYLYFVV